MEDIRTFADDLRDAVRALDPTLTVEMGGTGGGCTAVFVATTDPRTGHYVGPYALVTDGDAEAPTYVLPPDWEPGDYLPGVLACVYWDAPPEDAEADDWATSAGLYDGREVFYRESVPPRTLPRLVARELAPLLVDTLHKVRAEVDAWQASR